MPETIDPAVIVAAYQGIRSRCCELLRSLDDAQQQLPVAACPAWNVQQLACHLFGVPDDLLNGRLDNPGSDAWTDAQVERSRDLDCAAIADAWEATAEAFDALLLVIPSPTNAQIIFDSVSHEYDLRHAVGQPGPAESDALDIGAAFLLPGLVAALPEVAARLEQADLSGFERLRVITGRRSTAQLAELGIDGEALGGYLGRTPMTLTEVDIIETALA
jgi:uncharacterized protein (TIGR03083 family)